MLIPMNKFSKLINVFLSQAGEREIVISIFKHLTSRCQFFQQTDFIRSDTSWGSYNTHVFKTW